MKADRLILNPAAFVALTMALALAACNNEEPVNDPLADGPVALGVTAEISTATRASATSFEAGDPIGIFPVKDGSVETAQANKKYVSDASGNFTCDDPYYFQDREEVTFFAYYPHDESLTADNHTIAIDTRAGNQIQSTINGTGIAWRMNDYLSASETTSVSSPTVTYTFNHVMSRVIFVFEVGLSGDITALTGYSLDGLVMEGTFDVTTGEAKPTDTANKETLSMEITDASGATYTSTLILLPQTIEGDITLEVTYNDQTYTAVLTLPTGGLQAGYSYTYTVTIVRTELLVGISINDWETDRSFNGYVDATLL